MNQKFFSKKIIRGFTLIELLVAVFLASLVFLGIVGVVVLSIRISSDGQNKAIAAEIGSSEMEQIRNMPYNSIGTLNGYPSGSIEPIEYRNTNNNEYKIERIVNYIIDSKDGIALPEDECPNDYKRVEVKISWTKPFAGSADFVSDFAPENLSMECGENGGVLSATVFDSTGGQMIPSPLIEVKDPITGNIIKSASPSSGAHFFSLPIGTYKVVVTKTGYSSDETYGISEVAIPSKANPQILENESIDLSFSIDKLSSMAVSTFAPDDTPIPNVLFNIKGKKIIGKDNQENDVYKYSQNYSSGAGGTISITDLEPDFYTFSIISSGLNLTNIEPGPQPVNLAPDYSLPVSLFIEAQNSLKITIKDSETEQPIFSAQIRLYNDDVYDTTQYSDMNGITYFAPLDAGLYTLEVQAESHNSASQEINISGNNTTTIMLSPID